MQESYSRGSRRSRRRVGGRCAGLLALAVSALLSCGGHSRASTGAKALSIEPEVRQALLDAEHAESKRAHLEAEKHYERALSVARNAESKALAHREYGSTLVFWGEEERALVQFRASLEADPNQARVWHDSGVLLSRSGRQEGAQRALSKAVELAPADPRPRIALAALLVNMGAYRDALSQYRAILRLDIPPKIETAARKAIEILRIEIEKQGPNG